VDDTIYNSSRVFTNFGCSCFKFLKKTSIRSESANVFSCQR